MPKVAIVSSDFRRANFMIGIAPEEWDVFLVDHALTDDEKAPLLKDVDAVIAFPADVSPELMRCCPKVKLVQTLSAGYDRLGCARAGRDGNPRRQQRRGQRHRRGRAHPCPDDRTRQAHHAPVGKGRPPEGLASRARPDPHRGHQQDSGHRRLGPRGSAGGQATHRLRHQHHLLRHSGYPTRMSARGFTPDPWS